MLHFCQKAIAYVIVISPPAINIQPLGRKGGGSISFKPGLNLVGINQVSSVRVRQIKQTFSIFVIFMEKNTLQERVEGKLGRDPFNMSWPDRCFLTLLEI